MQTYGVGNAVYCGELLQPIPVLLSTVSKYKSHDAGVTRLVIAEFRQHKLQLIVQSTHAAGKVMVSLANRYHSDPGSVPVPQVLLGNSAGHNGETSIPEPTSRVTGIANVCPQDAEVTVRV